MGLFYIRLPCQLNVSQWFCRNYNVQVTTTPADISCHIPIVIAPCGQREQCTLVYIYNNSCFHSIVQTFLLMARSGFAEVLLRLTKHIFLLSKWPSVSRICGGCVFAFVSNTVLCLARPAVSRKHVWSQAQRWEWWIFTTSAHVFNVFKKDKIRLRKSCCVIIFCAWRLIESPRKPLLIHYSLIKITIRFM